ncbi:MAG: peptide chain release factor 1 [Deltaproteobacteria bacterium]|nr:MAG: peptide chain release factor 1 [Deltaproteobacteria bacterium]
MIEKELQEYNTIYTKILNEISELSAKKLDSYLSQRKNRLETIINLFHSVKNKEKLIEENKTFLMDQDLEIQELALLENANLENEINLLKSKIKTIFSANAPISNNIIVEIRAGTGGDEASIFAFDFFQMYSRFCERKQWKLSLMSKSESFRGGIKEIIFSISGENVFSWFEFESGVHRVQRIPETETQGRIHTSTCSVAVFNTNQNKEIKIEDKDLRIDVFRSSGPGGQSVNTTDSAVRITHIPSGMSVQCQDEKSQFKNKTKALKILKARLSTLKEKEEASCKAIKRREMIKSGDRSEKIRTYNFPQDRCTDHRINMSFHNLGKLFSGNLEEFLSQIKTNMYKTKKT